MASTDRTIDPVNVNFAVTTPTGNPRTTPLATTLTVPHGNLVAVELLIPRGHRGVTGFSLQLSGAVIVPYRSSFPWIIGDGDRLMFDVEIEVDTQLKAVTFNEGNFPHTHYLRLVVRSLPVRQGFVPISLVTNEALSA